MPSQIAPRTSFIFSHVLVTFSLNSSTSTPASSNSVPMTLSLPSKNAIKSSTSRARITTTATIASVLVFTPVNIDATDFNPLVILSKLNTANSDPAAIATSLITLSMPPSLSLNQTTPLRTLFSTLITLSNADTIVFAIVCVSPKVLSMSSSHRPHLFFMFCIASDTL